MILFEIKNLIDDPDLEKCLRSKERKKIQLFLFAKKDRSLEPHNSRGCLDRVTRAILLPRGRISINKITDHALLDWPLVYRSWNSSKVQSGDKWGEAGFFSPLLEKIVSGKSFRETSSSSSVRAKRFKEVQEEASGLSFQGRLLPERKNFSTRVLLVEG